MTTLNPSQISQIPSRSLPIGPQLSQILSEFTSLSLTLFSILSSPNPSSTSPILQSLSILDSKLARLLEMVAEHQSREREIEGLELKLESVSKDWLKGTTSLHTSIESLKPLLQSGELDLDSITLAKKSNITPNLLLNYARLLAPFTSAPPESLLPKESLGGAGAGGGMMDPSGRGLPPGAFPPFPTEGLIRRGRLQFGSKGGAGEGEDGEGSGVVGEMGEVGARKAVQVQVEELEAVVKLQMNAAKLMENGNHHGNNNRKKEDFSFDLDLNPHM